MKRGRGNLGALRRCVPCVWEGEGGAGPADGVNICVGEFGGKRGKWWAGTRPWGWEMGGHRRGCVQNFIKKIFFTIQ